MVISKAHLQLQLSLCLEMLFQNLSFEKRMEEAARLGYRSIEFWDWRNKDIGTITNTAARLGLTVGAMSGNRRNSLIDQPMLPALIGEIEEVIDVARRLDCRHIMMLTDVLKEDGSAASTSDASKREEYQSNVCEALLQLAKKVEGTGLMLLLEPLNTVLDHPGCFLNGSDVGLRIVQAVNHPQVRLLYDIYHMSMMGEDVVAEIAQKLPWIGYFHAADVPGRHEPGSGSIPWTQIRKLLESRAYRGCIGMECSASGNDESAARKGLEMFTSPMSA